MMLMLTLTLSLSIISLLITQWFADSSTPVRDKPHHLHFWNPNYCTPLCVTSYNTILVIIMTHALFLQEGFIYTGHWSCECCHFRIRIGELGIKWWSDQCTLVHQTAITYIIVLNIEVDQEYISFMKLWCRFCCALINITEEYNFVGLMILCEKDKKQLYIYN